MSSQQKHLAAAHRFAHEVAEIVQPLLSRQRRQTPVAGFDLQGESLPGLVHLGIADAIDAQVAGQMRGGERHHLTGIADPPDAILQRQQDGLAGRFGTLNFQHGTGPWMIPVKL